MATNADRTHESIDATLGSYGVPRIGTDAEGAVHYYDEASNRVLVTRDCNVVHIERLDDRPVSHWVGYVEQVRGWALRGDDAWLADLERIAAAAEDA